MKAGKVIPLKQGDFQTILREYGRRCGTGRPPTNDNYINMLSGLIHGILLLTAVYDIYSLESHTQTSSTHQWASLCP
jgi:hypothetical protein